MTNPGRSSNADTESVPGDVEARRLPRPQIVRTGPVVRPMVSLQTPPYTDAPSSSHPLRASTLRSSPLQPLARSEPTPANHPPKLAAVLSEWRRAEQLSETLPAAVPDHETATLLVGELRALYAELTNDTKPRTADAIASSQRTIRKARRVLDAIAQKASGRRTDDGSASRT